MRRILLAVLFAAFSPAALANTAAPKEKTAPATATETKVGFDVLGGFPFVPPAFDPEKPDDPVGPRVDEQIPSAVRKLDGRRVIITGYMLPTRMEGAQVLEFLLMRDQTMCCFGAQPQMNEWVVVRMEKPGVYLPDVPRSFGGVLRVGAVIENGYMGGIYLLEAAKVAR